MPTSNYLMVSVNKLRYSNYLPRFAMQSFIHDTKAKMKK